MSGRMLMLLLLGVLGAALVVAQPADRAPGGDLARGDKLFDDKHYDEAAAAYQAYIDAAEPSEDRRRAAERVIVCRLRLGQFDDALAGAERFIEQTAGTRFEARAERLTGNLYMLVPHWGTRAGGEFHRAQWLQGVQLRSEQHDRKFAAEHMERARQLYAQFDNDDLPQDERDAWHDERIECLFDLANIYARFGIYDSQPHFWFRAWSERDDFLADTAGEEDFDEYNSIWQRERRRPIGLRVDGDGKPIFPSRPNEYRDDMTDDERILFLLEQVREMDQSEGGRHRALATYRQAMLARARFGMDRLNQYGGMHDPLREQLDTFKPWELADDESLVLAGGRIVKATLPDAWNVLGLLRRIESSDIAPQARYGEGLYYQSRQQYTAAIEVYTSITGDSDWAAQAKDQIKRIRAPQVQIHQTGVQPPGEAAALQISYRNADKLYFTARRIDLSALLHALHNQRIDPDKGLRDFGLLYRWHRAYVNGYDARNHEHQFVAPYVGEEIARWSDAVPDDGTHRYAQATLASALTQPGAYLVQGYIKPPAEHDAPTAAADAMKLGDSAAVVVLTDLAIIEKPTANGRLFYVADARAGAPVPEANIELVHVWTTYDQTRRRQVHHKRNLRMAADAQGLAEMNYRDDDQGQLHAIVTAPDGRIAWTGMSYFSRYQPSQLRGGTTAYILTDRPVYRPTQTMHFKAWLRQYQNGTPTNPDTQAVHVTIHDPQGEKLYDTSLQTDDFGGIDGEMTLGEEPALGVYRINMRIGNQHVGSQAFRVEEYKKPEFEVTVEPGADHAKLGETVTATIRAGYYFGSPVTDATVTYRVFREEYEHRYYFPGRWDWLYGSGYGLPWYDQPWLSFRCIAPPPYWWYGGAQPVRELVMQGEAPIGADGKLQLDIDTQPALEHHGDKDHRYIIEAEVTDASRRSITGEGSIKVTRQSYYTFVQPDRGWYRPGEEMLIRIRCLTPGSSPVRTEGMVHISKVTFGGPDNAHIDETELQSWKAETDASGELTFRLRYDQSGQIRVRFVAPDQWGGTVEGNAMVWVCGEDFDGKLYRFNDLELITDKRSYEPGDVAHVMINTKRDASHVLFSDDVDANHLLSWRLLRIDGRSTVVNIPIDESKRPNFFVEATTIADWKLHEQTLSIPVPPAESVLDVDVQTDQPTYQPGDRAQVHVQARTLDGTPARAQIVLSAFDKSVLYIQQPFNQPIRKFFHGQTRHHYAQTTTNLLEQFSAQGHVTRPFQQLHPTPPSWDGMWGPMLDEWRTIADEDLRNMQQGGAVFGGVGGGGRTMMLRSQVAPPPVAMPADAGAIGGGPAVAERQDASPETFAETEVRSQFADTALWLAALTTDADGTATASFTVPDNLTTWQIGSWAMTRDTRVGEAETSAVSRKDVIVRLQTPRFFTERDEVVISANVHNYLSSEKTAQVSVEYPEDLLQLAGSAAGEVTIAPNGATRVDWRFKVIAPGDATIVAKALTDEVSDAMALTIPVLVHGMTKQVATTGSMRVDETDRTITIELNIPEERRPEQTMLEVRFAPSLIGVMLDALPYTIDYPYGCTEQTMSRFLPAVLTRKTIENLGISLEDLRHVRGRMDEVEASPRGGYVHNPVFDDAKLDDIISKSLKRITDMQNGDGGWGWWKADQSSTYLTAYVLHALCSARDAGVEIDENMIGRGMAYIEREQQEDLKHESWKPSESRAFAAYILSMNKRNADDLVARLYDGRDLLNNYGKALLAMALHNHEDARAQTVMRNIMQHVEINDETQVAWVNTPTAGWWYWWNNDIETNAWVLRALAKIDPQSDVAPRMVKWLLNNRRNGYYWRSTRDTTLCVSAISDYVAATGEGEPDYTLTLDYDDGAITKQIKINRDNFFTFDNRFVLEGVTLTGGAHTLRIHKEGRGALYFNTYLQYFTTEEPITAAGHELKLERTYYKLEQIEHSQQVQTADGGNIDEQRLRYRRVPLEDGDTVQSGDLVQVELRIAADNDYTFLAFEDPKPAGFEAVDVQSGYQRQEGFSTYMQLRDEKVTFFASTIGRGEHLLRYRLRAEIPGVFHALPTKVYGMYVPELSANSDEAVVRVIDE